MSRKIIMTPLRQRVIDLARTGPITSVDVAEDINGKLSTVAGMLATMAKVGLLKRRWVKQEKHGHYEYVLPSPDTPTPPDPQAQLPLEKAPPKPSIKPTSEGLWSQVLEVIGTRAHMSMKDMIASGVPHHNGMLHKLLTEMYHAGKLARWLAGDHYVYTLVNTLKPATATLGEHVQASAIPDQGTTAAAPAQKEKPDMAPSEADTLRAEVEELRRQLATARDEVRKTKLFSFELPPLAGGAMYEDMFVGDVVSITYTAAVALHHELEKFFTS